jgi:hypothetical protein
MGGVPKSYAPIALFQGKELGVSGIYATLFSHCAIFGSSAASRYGRCVFARIPFCDA